MTWFETLTGFPEEYPQQVRENITVDAQTLTSMELDVAIASYGSPNPFIQRFLKKY